MGRILEQLNPYLRVTRVSSAFAAVANVWFVVLWTQAMPQEQGPSSLEARPTWLILLCSGVAAVGLYTLSACMNDLIDVKRDRAYGKNRPIASGRMTSDAGAYLAVLALIAAAAGAMPLGPVALGLTLGLSAAILLYHVIGRFVPAVGLAMVGLIVAGQMLVPNSGLRFMWPVWLVLTHTLATFGLAQVYGRKVP
ncbi:MAG: UbiA family prenyltransferase, partial [Salinibacterium sp.]|nr:UbiA family prenyltransferase [Salinibacterium sp.]